MKNNVPALKELKNVYITACEFESESEIWVWGKITPLSGITPVVEERGRQQLSVLWGEDNLLRLI